MDIWKSLEEGYKFPKFVDELGENEDESERNHETTSHIETHVDQENRKQFEWNERVKNSILYVLVYAKFTKVMKCITTKDVWDKIMNYL